MASEAVWDLLPDYREHEPPARDALDVYINHRTLMEARTRNPGENRPTQNAFPPELMRRFEVNFKVNNIKYIYLHTASKNIKKWSKQKIIALKD